MKYARCWMTSLGFVYMSYWRFFIGNVYMNGEIWTIYTFEFWHFENSDIWNILDGSIPCFLMVTQNIISTYEGKRPFRRKKSICDSSRSYQMPYNRSIGTDIALYVRTYFLVTIQYKYRNRFQWGKYNFSQTHIFFLLFLLK